MQYQKGPGFRGPSFLGDGLAVTVWQHELPSLRARKIAPRDESSAAAVFIGPSPPPGSRFLLPLRAKIENRDARPLVLNIPFTRAGDAVDNIP